MDDGHPIIRILIFFIVLIMNAIFSGSSVALSAVNEPSLEKKAENGDRKAAKIFNYVKEPIGFLNTASLFATVIAIITGTFVAEPFCNDLTHLLMHRVQLPYAAAFVISYMIICFILSYFIIVFSILLPKKLAVKHAQGWCYRVIYFVAFFTAIAKPMSLLIDFSVNAFIRLAGINPKDIEESVTEESIAMMVNEGHEQGVIEESEAKMMTNILGFDDTEVADVMTHRRSICGIDINMSLEDAAEFMAKERFSRYPVYDGDTDNIIGILHLKDVMRLVLNGKTGKMIQDVMRAPLFVPDTQNINSLFKEMKAKKIHMAIVVDEYGQCCGLVAMEDILEEIVGNILDEYDQDENNIQAVGNDYLIRGLTSLDEVSEKLGITFDDGFETLNGFIISKLDRIPKPGEAASVNFGGYTFKVMNVINNTISQVKVSKITG